MNGASSARSSEAVAASVRCETRDQQRRRDRRAHERDEREAPPDAAHGPRLTRLAAPVGHEPAEPALEARAQVEQGAHDERPRVGARRLDEGRRRAEEERREGREADALAHAGAFGHELQTFAERRRSALPMTDTELPAIAAAASEGASRSPNAG